MTRRCIGKFWVVILDGVKRGETTRKTYFWQSFSSRRLSSWCCWEPGTISMIFGGVPRLLRVRADEDTVVAAAGATVCGRGIAMLGAAGLKPAPGASVLVSPVDAQGVRCPLGRGRVIVMLIATLPREPVLVECDRYLRTVYIYISVRRWKM